MGCSTPGFPVLHHILEFAQTCVHWVDDAIQLSHPLSPPLGKEFWRKECHVATQNHVLHWWFDFSVATPSFLECGFYHSLCSRCWAALWRRALSEWVFIPPASGSVGSWVLLRNGPQPESCLIQGHARSLEVGCVHVKGVKPCPPDARGDNSRAPGAGWGRPLLWLRHPTFHGEGASFPSAESCSLPFLWAFILSFP